MGFLDRLTKIYEGESKIFNKLPEKLVTGIVTSIVDRNPKAAAKAIALGAANPYFEWKERAENFYGKPIGKS